MFASFRKMLFKKERAWRATQVYDISTLKGRRKAERHFRWADAAILRVGWHNFHRIDDQAFRSNQPTAQRLGKYQQRGIKSIINLRGVRPFSHYQFEEEACKALGLPLHNHRLHASALPSRAKILALEDTFQQAEKPFLLHCKSGSDRTGFAAVLYLVLIKNIPLEVAQRQLGLRYLHFKSSKTGILDFFFDQYRLADAESPVSLHDWVATVYDPAILTARFKAQRRVRQILSGETR